MTGEWINEAMSCLPQPPEWRNERAVAEFVRLRPFKLVRVHDSSEPAWHGRARGGFVVVRRADAEMLPPLEITIADNPNRDLQTIPPRPQRTAKPGRPKAESLERNPLPAAEMAVVEVRWFLTKLYPQQKKGTIKARAIELVAEEFRIKRKTLRKYCFGRSAGERQRLGPRPWIDWDLIDLA
jgi:hypothetical protein